MMFKKIVSAVAHRAVSGTLISDIINAFKKLIIGIVRLLYKIVLWILKYIFRLINIVAKYVDYVVGWVSRYIMMKRQPVEDKVMLLTFQGDYTCNQKGIADKLIEEGFEYPIIWDVKSEIPMSDYPMELKFVKHGSYEFYRQLASAKVIIENTNIVERLGVYKKKNQYLLQTWHGSLGIKRLDGDVVMGRRWKRIAGKCQKYVDFCLSNSDFETEVFETSYWKGVQSLLVGHARNDIFFVQDEMKRQRIRKKVYKFLGIEENKKIFLFAPTHRDNVDENYEAIEYEVIMEALKKRFGGEWQIVVRFHNRLKKESRKWLTNLPEYISDATFYEDMQELLFCTEVGVTDYSSWIFDYVLMKKPGFIIELGLEDFKEQRGFYYPIETTPFPIAKDSQELAENILAFDERKYEEAVDRFLEERGCMEDGHASERITAKIRELIKNKA